MKNSIECFSNQSNWSSDEYLGLKLIELFRLFSPKLLVVVNALANWFFNFCTPLFLLKPLQLRIIPVIIGIEHVNTVVKKE